MQRRKIILWAAAFGALIGALATRHGSQGLTLAANFPAFAPDRALLVHRPFLLAAAAGWVLFSLYWEIAARDASAAKSSESKASRAIHVTLTNAALLLMAPIHGLGRAWPVSLPIMAAGLAVEAAGLFLAIWARRHLGRNWSGEITIKKDHELVRSGPYRWVRHPIYTGLLAMYAGVLLVTGEWLGVAGFVIAGLAYWRKTRMEEKNLDTAFGADYTAYRRETWALVPGIF